MTYTSKLDVSSVFKMELENRKRVLHKFIENTNASISSIAKSLKMPKTTVWAIIKRYKETSTIDRASGSGGEHNQANRKLRQKILRSVKANPGLSDNDRAKKFSCSATNVRKCRLRAGFKSYHAIKYPNRSDKQNMNAKKRARKLYDTVLTKFNGCIIMDDETYVKLDTKQLPGKKFYVSNVRGGVQTRYKYVRLDKYAKKVMIWQAICSCGLKSKAFVTDSTINSDIYIKECLQKRLLPFIRQYKSLPKFWPDLASCHYSKRTEEWYRNHGVDFIPKDMNPPNCPQFRPIEKYWGIVKAKLKKTGNVIKNTAGMRITWDKNVRSVDSRTVQALMGSINKNVREFIRSKDT